MDRKLIPSKCPVCGLFHTLRYEKLLRCVGKHLRGQVEYKDYVVQWYCTEVTVKPKDEVWRRKFGLVPFRSMRLPMKQGWRYLCGEQDLQMELFRGGRYGRLVDLDVFEKFIVFEVVGFEKWLKLSKGSHCWIEKYNVDLGQDFEISLCCCDSCKPTGDFEVCLDGDVVKVRLISSWIFLQFPVGRLEADIKSSDKHTNWKEEIELHWRKFSKIVSEEFRVYADWEWRGTSFAKGIFLEQEYLGRVYIDVEGNVTFR